jgi:head-tail adaptor
MGGDVITLSLVATVGGQVESLAGRERDAALAIFATAKYKITCQFWAGCQREYTLIWDTYDGPVSLDILDVRDIAGTRQRLDILAADYVTP